MAARKRGPGRSRPRGERAGGRSRRTGAGRAGSTRAGGPRRDVRTCAEPQSFRSPTRRSAPCCPAKHTGPAGGPSWRAIRRSRRPGRARPAISAPATSRVHGVDTAVGADRPRERHRVGEVAAVQQRLAPGRPAHDLDAEPRRRPPRSTSSRAGTARATAPAATSGTGGARAAHRRRPRRAGRGRPPCSRPPRILRRGRRSGASVVRGSVRPLRRALRYAGRVEQRVDLGRVGHLHHEDPARAVRVLVHQLRARRRAPR